MLVTQLLPTLCNPMDPKLLCPWNSPGKNIRVGCRFLLQEIFQTQGSNPCLKRLLHWQVDSLPLSHLGITLPTYGGLSSSVISFLSFHTVSEILVARILPWFAIPFSSGPCFVRTLHYDPSILSGTAQHGS